MSPNKTKGRRCDQCALARQRCDKQDLCGRCSINDLNCTRGEKVERRRHRKSEDIERRWTVTVPATFTRESQADEVIETTRALPETRSEVPPSTTKLASTNPIAARLLVIEGELQELRHKHGVGLTREPPGDGTRNGNIDGAPPNDNHLSLTTTSFAPAALPLLNKDEPAGLSRTIFTST
ncbi:hypothetical protein B0H67DRAFT_387335 [Lasiosphaeris hirsuta]|uniref:Zn(2)-C6 fungal-type domain-containing protein n=1 Tax=Lasiosphaeris hirsuta TaxID=260670 RepID=A0AA39ZY11_9PEZI|nr:hypothetical protein B0H67DRAFT_387335 [Lasiosphaeris hirsuta]